MAVIFPSRIYVYLMRHTGTTSNLSLEHLRVDDFALFVDSTFPPGSFDSARWDPGSGLPGRDVKGVCFVDFFEGQAGRFDEAV